MFLTQKAQHEMISSKRLEAICEQNPAFEIVEVDNLAVGMFVSELDCPWLKTPFLMQGFLIENDSELSQLRVHCKAVVIDRRRSIGEHFSDVRRWHSLRNGEQQPRETSSASSAEKGDFLAVARYIHGHKGALKRLKKKRGAGRKQSLEEQLLSTAPVIDDVHRMLRSFDEAKDALDSDNLAKVEELVGEMASGVERNPDAMLWLTRLRVTDQYSYDHAIDVCVHAMAFGRFLAFSAQEMKLLGQAGLLQDIGKMGVDPEILCKPSTLTEEEALEREERVLDLGTNAGFSPVGGFVGLRQRTVFIGALVGEVFRLRRQFPESFPLNLAAVGAIPVEPCFSAMQQIRHFMAVMNVGRRDTRVMHQAGLAIRPDVQLHPEVPIIAFLGLVHLRVAALVLVLGRGRRGDQGRIDNRAPRKLHAVGHQQFTDLGKEGGPQMVGFKQMSEVHQGRGIRHPLSSQINPAELPEHRNRAGPGNSDSWISDSLAQQQAAWRPRNGARA